MQAAYPLACKPPHPLAELGELVEAVGRLEGVGEVCQQLLLQVLVAEGDVVGQALRRAAVGAVGLV